MIEAVLTFEELHYECVGCALHYDYRRVEVGLVVHVLDNPVNECAEEVAFAKLYDSFGGDSLGCCQFV